MFHKLFIIGVVGLMLLGCTHEPMQPKVSSDDEITLIWHKSHAEAKRSHADTGILWLCSYLGADVNSQALTSAIRWEGNLMQLNLRKMGFSSTARTNIQLIYQQSAHTEQHQLHQAMDMGRFAALTLCASQHYYALTGVPQRLEHFISGRVQNQSYAIMQSTVSKGPRLVHMNAHAPSAEGWIAVAVEGSLDSAAARMDSMEYEVMDFMPNGQPRFAVYDHSGQLVSAADSVFSAGGKPAKCMWCHESNVNPNFASSFSHPEFLSVDTFNARTWRLRSEVREWQQSIPSAIHFDNLQNHSYAEWLYLEFYEPSEMRLASEWKMSLADVRNLLTALTPHDNPEFDFMKQRYHRAALEPMAPFTGLEVPVKPRELTTFEPTLISP